MLHSGCFIEAPQGVISKPQGEKKSNDGQQLESEMRTDTYRAPRTVTTVAPKFVTKTPHCSTAGTMEVKAVATTTFLTALEYDEQNAKQT